MLRMLRRLPTLLPPLLPPGHDLAWTPYAHLVYLGFFLVQPLVAPQVPRGWTVLGLLVFLVAYFRGYWESGLRILGPIAVLVALGMVFGAWNVGASCFFIYAGAFVPQYAVGHRGVRLLLFIMAFPAVAAATYQHSVFFWAPALIFTPLVGGINIHYKTQALADAKLRQSREEVERLAKIAERERIARDLHDLLGHTLSTITLKAELASKLAARDPQRAAEEMREVERISRQATKEVRTAVVGYRSRSLAEEIVQVRTALDAAGVTLELDLDDDARTPTDGLDAQREGVLSMALREAVTNVIRHSGASRCVVRLRRDGDGLRLEVADDGVGARAPEGAGLAGMRERLAGLGGRLERIVENGTRLEIHLPAGSAA